MENLLFFGLVACLIALITIAVLLLICEMLAYDPERMRKEIAELIKNEDPLMIYRYFD